MLVYPHERARIARLLRFLAHGERLAHECAQAQAALVPDDRSRRFLLGQARQERLHAVIFQGAIAWLAPRQLGTCSLLPPLQRYRALLQAAILERNLFETILAEQIILEGLGEAILQRIEDGLAKRRAGFGRLRRVLLRQEEVHHAFGCRVLERAIAEGRADPARLRERAEEYLALSDAMILSLGELFASVGEDATAWAADTRSYLPGWLVA